MPTIENISRRRGARATVNGKSIAHALRLRAIDCSVRVEGLGSRDAKLLAKVGTLTNFGTFSQLFIFL